MLRSCVAAALLGASAVQAQTLVHFDLPAQPLAQALRQIGNLTNTDILVAAAQVAGRKAPALKADLTADQALARVLVGSGLALKHVDDHTIVIASAASTTAAPAAPQPAVPVSDPPTAKSGDAPPAGSTGDDQTSSAQQPISLEEVVVTGTHLRGVKDVGIPSLSLTRADIDNAGYTTVQDLMSTLPQNSTDLTMLGGLATGARGIANNNINNATAIDLRGLGPQSTLTLLDGERVAGNVQGRVVDVSMIPMSMVERIDITTGGASAVYGADAVAGVANIILRHDYDGADSRAYYGGTDHGGNRAEFDQLLGHTWSSGGVMLAYEFGRDTAFNVADANLVMPISSAGIETRVQDAIPNGEQQSLYVSGHFEPDGSSRLYASGYYFHKSQSSLEDTYVPVFTEDLEEFDSESTALFGGTIGGSVAIGGWRVDVHGYGSTLDNTQTTTALTTLGASPPTTLTTPIDTRSGLYSVSAVADGNLVSVGDGAVNAAFGAEGRRETLTNSVPSVPTAAIAPTGRSVASAFAEVDVPVGALLEARLLRGLIVTGAARNDHYSDFGNAFNPQGSLVWAPIDALTLRASIARAFRAPDLYTLNRVTTNYIVPESVQLPGEATPTTLPTLFPAGGNPDIGPETANTWTTGVDLKVPANPNIRMSLSFFSIDYANRIEQPYTGVTVASPAQFPGNILILHPTPAQVASYLALGPFEGNYSGVPWDGNPQTLLQQIPNLIIEDDRYLNVASEAVRGVDLLSSAKFETVIGTASLGANVTRTFHHLERITPQSAPISLINEVGAPVGFRARVNAGLTRGAFSGFVYVNYLNSYTNQYTSPVSTIGSWTTVDLTLRFDASVLAPHGPWAGWNVTASAQNLLARNPPFFGQNFLGLAFDAANASPLGRYLSLSIAKKW